jgi:adenylate cyclase
LTSERMERRLAAVLAADVAGYSRLMGRNEERTLANLKSARRTLIDPTIAAYRGRIVKTTGDGMLVEFASAVDAARCAIDVQRGMAVQNADVSQEVRLEFRIGVHVGDIIIDDNDIFGDGVNIAARLEGIAEPGGVCISDDAQRQVRGKLDVAFDDIGPQALKNIAEPMRVWRVRLGGAPVAAAAGNVAQSAQPLALPEKPSIAVLPFQNLSGDPEKEYFADGMVEDIITALSKVKWFFVIARNSSFTYKGKHVDIRQVGRELGVRYVLEGSIRKAGNRIRITGQLIEAATGSHVWADKLEGDLEDIFDLQDRITETVVAAIEPSLNFAEIRRSSSKPTDSLDAYDFYLRALPVHAHCSDLGDPRRDGRWSSIGTRSPHLKSGRASHHRVFCACISLARPRLRYDPRSCGAGTAYESKLISDHLSQRLDKVLGIRCGRRDRGVFAVNQVESRRPGNWIPVRWTCLLLPDEG